MSKVQVASISQYLGLRTDTPASKCPTDYSPDCADNIFTPGGMATRPPFRRLLTMPAEIVYRKEFTCKDGTVQILACDINGVLYVSSNGAAFVQVDTVRPGSSVCSVTAYGREYMSFFKDGEGSDDPRQWDGNNLYRVSQGGPGSAPMFAASAITTDSYPIASITQPAPQARGSSYFLQAAAPGSGSPGTVATVYYSDSTIAPQDSDLVNAFNSGFPTYVYFSFTGVPTTIGPLTALVTGVGLGQPPGQPRNFFYFTFDLPSSAYQYYAGSGHPGYTANYQRTLTTLTTSVPVPDLEVGDNVQVAGTSVPNWNNTWHIAQQLDSGLLNITQTSLIGGVGTYHYTAVTGQPPTVGQLVTVKGTLNGNDNLNVTNATIATATGITSGTFTVNGLSTTTDYPLAGDTGQAITAGTIFAIDPGVNTLGTMTSPIFGNATGGTLTFLGSNASIAAGKRKGVMFGITDTGAFTPVSPIFTFTVPANTAAIVASNLVIMPPNIVARGIAFTGANGSKFFYLPIPPQVNGVVSGTSTLINDNTSTSATFNFSDVSLFGGIAIDIPGNNLFRQVPLNLPRGVDWYSDRMFWLGEKNTVFNFLNMGMDGGTLSGAVTPAGWTSDGTGSIAQVGIMPAYAVTGPNLGTISQPAATTLTGDVIIQPNLRYSLRFWMLGTGSKVGTLTATLSSALTSFTSTASFNLAGLTYSGYYTVDFSAAMPRTIPADLVLAVQYTGLVETATVRQLQLIYADNPNRNPLARASYLKNPEAFDVLTGDIGPNDDSSELRAIFVLQESLHFLTANRLYSVQQIGTSEPSSWDPVQVSDKCGAFNANSVATGKGWAAWGGPLGSFWYSGGLPEKPSSIIAPTWRNVAAISNIYDDADAERVYFGLVNGAGVKSGLVYDYHELALGGVGKWSPWNRPIDWIGSSAGGTVFVIGPKFYELDAAAGVSDDDFGNIGGYYVFAPFGVSAFQKQYDYMGLRISGFGPMTPFLYTKTLQGTPQTLAMGTLESLTDTVAEWQTLQLRARLLYLKLGQPGVQFSLEDATVIFQSDPNAPISGVR